MTQITQTTLGNFREARAFLITQEGVVRVSKTADAEDNGAAEYGGFDANDAQIARMFKGGRWLDGLLGGRLMEKKSYDSLDEAFTIGSMKEYRILREANSQEAP